MLQLVKQKKPLVKNHEMKVKLFVYFIVYHSSKPDTSFSSDVFTFI